MDIKKLFIVMVCVGFAPTSMRSDNECMRCSSAQSEYNWQLPEGEYQDNDEDPLIEFVEKYQAPKQCTQLPSYKSRPANVSFHTQTHPCEKFKDPYGSCDAEFQEEMEEEEEQEAEKSQPYIVIYEVK